MKGSSWRLYGIDFSDEVARKAVISSEAEVFVGDILAAPFPERMFDAITCFHVFEHLYQPYEVLARVSAWLKPGGVFYTMVPNIDSAGARIFGSYWYALELPRHLYHFCPSSLRALAREVGLEEVSVTTHRELFLEGSVRYIIDALLRRVGLERVPMARAKPPGLAWRVVRKIFRLTVLRVLSGLAAFVGSGESIHAVFRKPAVSSARNEPTR
jgi:SAM-dependent methyltransferase